MFTHNSSQCHACLASMQGRSRAAAAAQMLNGLRQATKQGSAVRERLSG